ncbi:hypothetical protein DH2020_007159 [Rehmannia glutinosa]|uniref:Filament-like plant protein n=1 Tax=Rehmannia glutinosa TaxID=99300 RepID=A0ABR0TX78_REHGL
MEKKKKWLWKRKSSSERSLGESESSTLFSSHSERYSDVKYALKETSNDSTQSAKVTSKASITYEEEMKESVKNLTKKLSAVFVNISAKEDLVKQHAKVAQEAVAEARASHLDGALKECVRQLRQGRDEQEKKISDAIAKKNKEWESKKVELEKQILELNARTEHSASIDPKSLIFETLEKENLFLKQELKSKCKELENMINERDLSTQAAETAYKLQSESKKMPLPNNLVAYSVEIDMMDDFLEMERLVSGESVSNDNALRGEFDSMVKRVGELERKLEKLEAEKLGLETALVESRDFLKSAQRRTDEAEKKLGEMQKEMDDVNEGKELLEIRLVAMEVESRTMSANVDLMRGEIEKERKLSAELNVKCQELENELKRTVQENVIQQNNTNLNGEVKLKQVGFRLEEDLAVAVDKLAECQKTIASLAKQLKSLATLEDFLIDTSNIPGFTTGPSNNMFCNLDPSRISTDKNIRLENGNGEDPPAPSTLPSSSASYFTVAKSRNGFGKLFSRSKSMRVLNNQDIKQECK